VRVVGWRQLRLDVGATAITFKNVEPDAVRGLYAALFLEHLFTSSNVQQVAWNLEQAKLGAYRFRHLIRAPDGLPETLYALLFQDSTGFTRFVLTPVSRDGIIDVRLPWETVVFEKDLEALRNTPSSGEGRAVLLRLTGRLDAQAAFYKVVEHLHRSQADSGIKGFDRRVQLGPNRVRPQSAAFQSSGELLWRSFLALRR